MEKSLNNEVIINLYLLFTYKTSAAIQMSDLAKEISSRNIDVDILTAEKFFKT